jgi:hypothetical protein
VGYYHSSATPTFEAKPRGTENDAKSLDIKIAGVLLSTPHLRSHGICAGPARKQVGFEQTRSEWHMDTRFEKEQQHGNADQA